MKVFIFGILLVAASLLMGQGKRPYNGGTPWQVKSTLLTGTPVAVSSMVGSPAPPANTDILVCQGTVSTASSSSTDTVAIDAGDGTHPYPSFKPWSGTGGSGAIVSLWAGSGTTGCEWMPGGMLISASGTGIYFRASGVY